MHYGQLKAGDTVLIQGTGGVAIFGLQLAHALGARVLLTTSSAAKGERARALGAAAIINYAEQPAWEQAVLALTGGRGVDQVLEVAGGDGLNQSVQAARPEGYIALTGFLQGKMANLDLMAVHFRKVRLQGIGVGHRQGFEEMNQAFARYNIRPVIDAVYDFEEAKAAYEHLSRGAFGKIVIRIGARPAAAV